MKNLLTLVLLLSLATFASAQSTTVSATITDAGAQVWNNGTYSFTFQPAASNPTAQYFWNGAPFSSSQTFSGVLSGSGAFSTSIPSSTAITPSGSAWVVQVCPAASSPCYNIPLTITGTTQSISGQVIPPAVQVNLANAPNGVSAYTDSEIIGAKTGNFYFNLTDSSIHTCNGFPPCTWSVISSASSILGSNNSFTGVNTFTQPIVGSITGNAATATTAVTATFLFGPGTVNGNYTHSGIETFTGTIQCKNFEQMRCVDSGNSQGWGGGDPGAWINSAYADLPSTGGDILLAAGGYSQSTAISFSTANKPARLVCAPGGATTITYTGGGTAFTYNVAGASGSHLWGGGLENCTLVGPSAAGSTVGILLGGTNGAEGVVRRNVKVTGFGTAETYGNNAYLTLCSHCVYIDNGIDLNIPNTLTNSGESFSYVETAFANSSGAHNTGCVSVAAPVNNLSIMGSSFDNCQFALSAGQVHLVDNHFENPNSGMTVPFIAQTGGRLALVNPDFEWDNFAAPSPSAAATCSSGLLTANNETFFSGTTTIASDYLLSGTCEFHETGLKLTSGFTNFYLTSTSGAISTFGNIWASNQLIGAGDLLLSGGKLKLGPLNQNYYTFVPANPSTFRNINIVDQGQDWQMASTLNANGNYQTTRGTAGCTTAASIGATCNFTVTWPHSFIGTNYSVACTPSGGATNLPSSPYVTTKNVGSVVVNYFAITAAAATWSFVDCVGVMD